MAQTRLEQSLTARHLNREAHIYFDPIESLYPVDCREAGKSQQMLILDTYDEALGVALAWCGIAPLQTAPTTEGARTSSTANHQLPLI